MVENSPLKGISEYEAHITNPMDKSWLYKMDTMMKQASSNFVTYDYASALELIEKRFWDFCDYYLEIVKKRAYSETDTSAVASLMKTIDTFLKAFAPFCPFITEEVYQCRPWGETSSSIHGTSWPKDDEFANIVAENSDLYDNASIITSEIRKAKTTANTSQRTAVSKVVVSAPVELQETLKEGLEDIVNVGNLNPNALEFKEAKELSVDEVVLDLEAVA